MIATGSPRLVTRNIDSDLYLKLTEVDSEPTQPVVGFTPHQLATQVTHPEWDSSKQQNLLGTTPPHGQEERVTPI